jgi:hypothetical protein
MLTTLMRGALVASLAVFGAGCDASPTASAGDAPLQASAGGAERWVDESFYDVTDSFVEFACDEFGNHIEDGGELVRLRGGIYSSFVATITPSGNVLVNYHTMPVGLGGTGVDSGEEFRVKEAEHGHFTLTDVGATTPYRFRLTLAGRDTGRRMTVVFKGMLRIDDRGVVVEREREYVECRV